LPPPLPFLLPLLPPACRCLTWFLDYRFLPLPAVHLLVLPSTDFLLTCVFTTAACQNTLRFLHLLVSPFYLPALPACLRYCLGFWVTDTGFMLLPAVGFWFVLRFSYMPGLLPLDIGYRFLHRSPLPPATVPAPPLPLPLRFWVCRFTVFTCTVSSAVEHLPAAQVVPAFHLICLSFVSCISAYVLRCVLHLPAPACLPACWVRLPFCLQIFLHLDFLCTWCCGCVLDSADFLPRFYSFVFLPAVLLRSFSVGFLWVRSFTYHRFSAFCVPACCLRFVTVLPFPLPPPATSRSMGSATVSPPATAVLPAVYLRFYRFCGFYRYRYRFFAFRSCLPAPADSRSAVTVLHTCLPPRARCNACACLFCLPGPACVLPHAAPAVLPCRSALLQFFGSPACLPLGFDSLPAAPAVLLFPPSAPACTFLQIFCLFVSPFVRYCYTCLPAPFSPPLLRLRRLPANSAVPAACLPAVRFCLASLSALA